MMIPKGKKEGTEKHVMFDIYIYLTRGFVVEGALEDWPTALDRASAVSNLRFSLVSLERTVSFPLVKMTKVTGN